MEAVNLTSFSLMSLARWVNVYSWDCPQLSKSSEASVSDRKAELENECAFEDPVSEERFRVRRVVVQREAPAVVVYMYLLSRFLVWVPPRSTKPFSPPGKKNWWQAFLERTKHWHGLCNDVVTSSKSTPTSTRIRTSLCLLECLIDTYIRKLLSATIKRGHGVS